MCDHSGMTDRPEQRPEGRLIAVAQKRPRLSNREAAQRAGMSEGHWRAIVSGSRSMGKDLWMPVRAPADTLARMAQVVGVTPEQLDDAGREDAAEELRALIESDRAQGDDLTPVGTKPTIEELAAALARVERNNAELRRQFEEFIRERGPRESRQEVEPKGEAG